MPTIPATDLATDQCLHKALNAIAPLGNRGKWASILPAVQVLLDRHFSLSAAIDWLVQKRRIQATDRKSAYFSIAQRYNRAGLSIKRGKSGKTKEPSPERKARSKKKTKHKRRA